MKPGPGVKGHASDQVVSGRVAEVSEEKVKIESKGGESKELELAPQTLIDGKTGNHQALKEGEQVRASFDEADGKSVAVEIHSRKGAGKDASPGQGGSMERGSTGSQQGGSDQQGGSGSGAGSEQQGGAGSQQGGTQQR
jgi:Cu/Ag efflux protein CusF